MRYVQQDLNKAYTPLTTNIRAYSIHLMHINHRTYLPKTYKPCHKHACMQHENIKVLEFWFVLAVVAALSCQLTKRLELFSCCQVVQA